MDELVPNPDGCRAFEPNQFKKEKCKNCGRPWQEHLGVISEALVNSYTGAKRKATEDKLQKEAEAQAKLKAKAVAKKKAQQAVEDEWLFDSKEGDKGAVAGAESDDDDMGFRMFSAQDLAQAPVESRVASNSFKPLQVKNLIDFDECDVAEELGTSSPSMPPVEMEAAAKPPTNTPCSVPSASSSSSAAPPAVATTTPTSPEEQGSVMADLLAEMDNLKHMLRNANEEKNIQVAIVQDEVAEKKIVIEDMKSQRNADQAEIAKLREQLANAGALQQQATEADALRQQLEERNAEIERLKAVALAPPPPAPSDPAQEEELTRLRLEVEELRKAKAKESVALTLPAAMSARLSEAYALCITTCKTLEEDASITLPPTLGEEAPEDALRHLCEAAQAVQAAASRSSTERRHLLQKLSEAEVAAKTAMSAGSISISKPPSTLTEALQEAPQPAEALPQEVVHQQVVHRQAALALREVRLNAERQLAWISKRIKTSYQDGRGSAISCP